MTNEVATAGAAAQVSSLVSALDRGYRAACLYAPGNPARDQIVARLQGVIHDVLPPAGAPLMVDIRDGQFVHGEDVIHDGEGKDALGNLLTRHGVLRLVFLPGLHEEVEALLDVFGAARTVRDDQDDLVSLLWQAEIVSLRYEAVELADAADQALLADPAAPETFDIDVTTLTADLGRAGEGEGAPESNERPTVAPTLYSFDVADLDALQAAAGAERSRDVRRPVIDALLDQLESAPPARAERAGDALDELVPVLLSRGALADVTYIMRQVDGLAPDRPDPVAETLSGRLRGALSDDEVVAALLGRVSDLSEESQEPMVQLLKELSADTLPLLIRTIGGLEPDDPFRTTLMETGRRLVAADPEVAIRTFRNGASPPERILLCPLLAASRRALPDLTSAARSEDEPITVRRAAVRALAESGSTSALSTLASLVAAEDRAIRLTALNCLTEREYQPAARYLVERLGDRGLAQVDEAEAFALFEAVAACGDASAILPLQKVLKRVRFGRTMPAHIRAGAATALGALGAQKAWDALSRAAEDNEPVVRHAARKAMESRRSA